MKLDTFQDALCLIVDEDNAPIFCIIFAMIKNVCFDFNGTILNDVDLTLELENELLEESGRPRIPMDFYLDHFGFPVRDYYLLIGFDFKDISYDELNAEFMKRYLEREASESSLYEGFRECAEKLKAAGIGLYCLSASRQDILESQLKRLGIYDLFDGIIGAKDIEAKSKIEYGKEYFLGHGIKPEETLMLGDTIHDYEVAKAIGLKPAFFTSGHCSKKRLSKYDVPQFEDYGRFCDYVISKD